MGKKKKILFIVNKLRVGGAENIIVSAANLIDKDKYDAYVGELFSTKRAGNFYDRLKIGKDKIIRFEFTSVLSLNGLLKIYKFLKDNRVDIVYTSLFESNLVARLAAILARTPIIISSEVGIYSDRKMWQRIANRFLSYFTDVIVANANDVAEFTAKFEKIDMKKFKVIKNITELSTTGIFTRAGLRHDLAIPANGFVAMTVGRFSPEKAQYRVIDAADQIINQAGKTDYYFLIVGSGDLKDSLLERVKEKKLASNVRIIDDPNRAKEYLVAGDVFLLPSDTEGQPIAMLEAMNAGLACIAFDVGGVKESLADNVNGFLLEKGDIEGMVKKINWLEINRDNLSNMQANAKITAGNFQNSIKDLENLIDRLYLTKPKTR